MYLLWASWGTTLSFCTFQLHRRKLYKLSSHDATMPVVSTTAEMSFSVLRRFNYYVRSPMKNDRLSSLGLMHINRDFEVDLYKAMEVFVSAKTRRADFSIVFIEG
jgi:hypothetical protein